MSAENTQNKIVNVRGVQFDISSILNDVTASIQNNIQKSLDGALKDYELYKSTHDAILQIPFVRDLYIQNQELISQLDQPIQLKIDEILPPSSPVVMRSYFQFDSNHNEANKKNKKLSEEEESKSAIQSESSTELESSEEESEAEQEESESEAEQEEEESEAEQEQEESEAEEEESESESEAEQEQEESEAEQEESEAEQEQEEEEEVEQEQEQEEEVEQEEEEAEEEQEKEEEQEEEAEEEVYEIVIKNVTYFTTNENDGDIYSCVDGDVGEVVGKFKNKKPVFTRRK
jgi:DNA polymerase III gamma/tau subunit